MFPIHDGFSTQRAHVLRFLFGPNRGEYAGSRGQRHLNGVHPDAPGATVHQHRGALPVLAQVLGGIHAHAAGQYQVGVDRGGHLG